MINTSLSNSSTNIQFWREARGTWHAFWFKAKSRCLPTEAGLALGHAVFAETQRHAAAVLERSIRKGTVS